MRRRRRRQRGQALVETALVLPVFLLILFGLIDIGRAVFLYNTVSEGARQASRLAVVDQTAADVTAQALVTSPAADLAASDVTVCFKDPGAAVDEATCTGPKAGLALCSSATPPDYTVGCLAVVEITTSYRPITPIVSSFLTAIPITTRSVNPIEYVCPTPSRSTCP
jgi:Flp pilus assembly protein TadG